MGAAGLDQQDHPLPSIQERHRLPTEEDSQVRTCRITGAGEVRHEHLASAAEDYLDHLGPSSEDIAYEQWHVHTVSPLPVLTNIICAGSRSTKEQDYCMIRLRGLALQLTLLDYGVRDTFKVCQRLTHPIRHDMELNRCTEDRNGTFEQEMKLVSDWSVGPLGRLRWACYDRAHRPQTLSYSGTQVAQLLLSLPSWRLHLCAAATIHERPPRSASSVFLFGKGSLSLQASLASGASLERR